MAIELYRDLRVWKDAMNLAEVCCQLTPSFPRDELYGMTARMRSGN